MVEIINRQLRDQYNREWDQYQERLNRIKLTAKSTYIDIVNEYSKKLEEIDKNKTPSPTNLIEAFTPAPPPEANGNRIVFVDPGSANKGETSLSTAAILGEERTLNVRAKILKELSDIAENSVSKNETWNNFEKEVTNFVTKNSIPPDKAIAAISTYNTSENKALSETSDTPDSHSGKPASTLTEQENNDKNAMARIADDSSTLSKALNETYFKYQKLGLIFDEMSSLKEPTPPELLEKKKEEKDEEGQNGSTGGGSGNNGGSDSGSGQNSGNSDGRGISISGLKIPGSSNVDLTPFKTLFGNSNNKYIPLSEFKYPKYNWPEIDMKKNIPQRDSFFSNPRLDPEGIRGDRSIGDVLESLSGKNGISSFSSNPNKPNKPNSVGAKFGALSGSNSGGFAFNSVGIGPSLRGFEYIFGKPVPFSSASEAEKVNYSYTGSSSGWSGGSSMRAIQRELFTPKKALTSEPQGIFNFKPGKFICGQKIEVCKPLKRSLASE